MSEISKPNFNTRNLILAIVLAVGVIYFFSNPKPQHYYDYTFRVADNMLRGQIGFTEKPPSWLNEFVPFDGGWYSVFPLGAVVSMMPFALLKVSGAIKDMPSAFIAALSASVICLFLFLIARRYEMSLQKRILMTLVILFGTWMWTNETFGGAWQLALGFAMIGELGAIYFTVYDRKPFLAGLFFAIAFGNRTENLLTAPIFMFLLLRDSKFQIPDSKFTETESQNLPAKKQKHKKKEKASKPKPDNQSFFKNIKSEMQKIKSGIWNLQSGMLKRLALFCVVPFVLGVSTLVYNYVRFRSFTDFGYARIPGVLEEPWYNHGIFSWHYIPGQAYEMLFKLWETKPAFPYLVPDGFSSSILFSSPFLFLLLRNGWRDKALKYVSWLAIVVLTILLWMHGNSGGWQFGYRYAMVLLPWIFVILLENSPKKITFAEWLFYIISFVLNAFAVYLFHWSGYMKV